MSKFSVLCVSFVTCAVSVAEPILGEAELGFVSTDGNSDTQTINAKLKLTTENQGWAHQANLTAFNNASGGATTAEKYTFAVQSDRKLDERSSLYMIATHEEDHFSGFDYQSTVGVGYGYKMIDDDERSLTLEAGPGYRMNAVTDGDKQNEITLRLAEIYSWKFSDTAELNQHLTIEGGDENTISNLGASIKSSLTGSLALKVGFDIKHTDKVPANRDDTDTETYATVTYSF